MVEARGRENPRHGLRPLTSSLSTSGWTIDNRTRLPHSRTRNRAHLLLLTNQPPQCSIMQKGGGPSFGETKKSCIDGLTCILCTPSTSRKRYLFTHGLDSSPTCGELRAAGGKRLSNRTRAGTKRSLA
ncbi:uncharacterized protein PV07_09203 [Cladophialophora immunda]|uniref:Uncharacterized protein n=1 Tax=Cladophialophora immunda TaxID=569365 RepID=A0A0D2C6H4_9EURO|nr:uncharacterized protein PV07_09203 [Cladophialophora immunda]KIW26075.1 hypothetical protein PV07_09203 [Cladophialophora immunda]